MQSLSKPKHPRPIMGKNRGGSNSPIDLRRRGS
jgi:hypothetical protein